MSATELSLETIDRQLDKVLVNQLIWKNPSCARIAVRICNCALTKPQFYPEDISHDDLPADDVNCIGSMFRTLAGKKLGIIERSATTFKRSEAEGRRGSTVFAYGVKSRALAASLVRRLGGRAETPQLQLL